MENYIIIGTSNVESFIDIMRSMKISPSCLKLGIPEELIYEVNNEAIKKNISILVAPLSFLEEIRSRIETGLISPEEDSDIVEIMNAGERHFYFMTLVDRKEEGPGVLIPVEKKEEKVIEYHETHDQNSEIDISDLKIALNTMDVNEFIESL